MAQTVAHCLAWYLPPTMGYIHDQLVALGPERSVVLAAEAVDPDRFPFERVYILSPPARSAVLPPRARAFLAPSHHTWGPTLHRERVAALHAHDGRVATAFLPLARHYGLPLVTTFLGRDASATLDGRYTDALLQLFTFGDLFTVMSGHMAGQLRRLGCPECKIRVIHYGIPLSRFPFVPRAFAGGDRPVILFTGRLIPKKGPDDLARAFSLLCRSHRSVRLKVIGDGPLRPIMERILVEAGLGDRVEFLGTLDPGAAAAEMRGAHLFCLPSCVGPDGDSEGVPTVLKEAMASGLPVVSTRHAGIPELVEDGVSGYLVPEHDPMALSERLGYLLDHPERWEAMGRAGRTKVESEFSVERVASRLDAEVYAPLLGRPSPAGHAAAETSRHGAHRSATAAARSAPQRLPPQGGSAFGIASVPRGAFDEGQG